MLLIPIMKDYQINVFVVKAISIPLFNKIVETSREYFSKVKEEVINTTVTGGMIDRLGVYDYLNEFDGKVLSSEIVSAHHEAVDRCYGNDELLTKEEKRFRNAVVGGSSNAKVKVVAEYYSEVAKCLMRLRKELLDGIQQDPDNDEIKIINLTDLIRIMNSVTGVENRFIYNRMLDKKEELTMNQKFEQVFFSMEEYYNFIKKEAEKVNDKIILEDELTKKKSSDIIELISKFFAGITVRNVQIEYYDLMLCGKMGRVLRDFAERNAAICDYDVHFNKILENNSTADLCLCGNYEKYDCNGERERKKIAADIEKWKASREALNFLIDR